MIVKTAEYATEHRDSFRRAGQRAESQMAFYLNRDFGHDPGVFVLNDLRVEDPEQPEGNGAVGACQVDHLVVHRHGIFIVESKSVTSTVKVRSDGSGGDQWTRMWNGRETGMPSPIEQGRRQGEFLKRFLHRHHEVLLGKMPIGLRTLSKLIYGSDQRGFQQMPSQTIVAISDGGIFQKLGRWREPSGAFAMFVCKADNVCTKIAVELKHHRASAGIASGATDEYGLWSMSLEECAAVAEFLATRHTPRAEDREDTPESVVAMEAPREPRARATAAVLTPNLAAAPPVSNTAGPRCKGCGGQALAGLWGKYGYYWKCESCGVNTAMPVVCSACGAEGHRGEVVRIRKEGPKFYRRCEKCGIDERIWTEP